MTYHDLGEHAGALVTLLGVLGGVCSFLLWRMLARMERKLEDLSQHFCWCREELAERFVTRHEHEADRQDLWEAVNHHDHDLRGRVVR